jgi:hypothetical protein
VLSKPFLNKKAAYPPVSCKEKLPEKAAFDLRKTDLSLKFFPLTSK